MAAAFFEQARGKLLHHNAALVAQSQKLQAERISDLPGPDRQNATIAQHWQKRAMELQQKVQSLEQHIEAIMSDLQEKSMEIGQSLVRC